MATIDSEVEEDHAVKIDIFTKLTFGLLGLAIVLKALVRMPLDVWLIILFNNLPENAYDFMDDDEEVVWYQKDVTKNLWASNLVNFLI